MSEPVPYNFIGNPYAEEKLELEETEISSLLDFPAFSPDKSVQNGQSKSEKYLIFRLENKLYGILSEKISEVLNHLKITPLPNVPEQISGIANLRGSIIPVVDLRPKGAKNPPAQKQKLLVFQPSKMSDPVALTVDKVIEITEIAGGDILFSAADFEDSFPSCFGKAECKSQTVLLLDVEKLLSSLHSGESYAH